MAAVALDWNQDDTKRALLLKITEANPPRHAQTTLLRQHTSKHKGHLLVRHCWQLCLLQTAPPVLPVLYLLLNRPP